MKTMIDLGRQATPADDTEIESTIQDLETQGYKSTALVCRGEVATLLLRSVCLTTQFNQSIKLVAPEDQRFAVVGTQSDQDAKKLAKKFWTLQSFVVGMDAIFPPVNNYGGTNNASIKITIPEGYR